MTTSVRLLRRTCAFERQDVGNYDTYNPRPRPRRIHITALGVAWFPEGKLEWADRATDQRLEMYQRGLQTSWDLGGLAVINHPSWHWGIDGGQLAELATRGYMLFEIANQQFEQWNNGDARHPALEVIWDQALTAGATIWGIATDDAHSYDPPGQYPAGGGWIVVDAERDPAAIRSALERGAFYGSTGVVLSRAGVEDAALVAEVDPQSVGDHLIRFIGDGRVLREVTGRSARFPLAEGPGYVRAVVISPTGATAWLQPARPAP